MLRREFQETALPVGRRSHWLDRLSDGIARQLFYDIPASGVPRMSASTIWRVR
jgi:hypothetical protein